MSTDLAEIVTQLTTQLKDLADDVHHADMMRAVRRNQPSDVKRHGAHCKTAIDVRAAPHCSGVLCALSAPPLWLAVYKRDRASVLALLKQKADADCRAQPCPAAGGRAADCHVGLQSALHVAVSRSHAECVGALLGLGADACAPQCFAVDEDDEPEYDERTDSFDDGLSGLSALQLAAVKGDDGLCQLLLAHGADAASLEKLPASFGPLPPAIAAATARLTGDDGEPLECAICMDEVRTLTAEWTPCCVRAFHRHCIAGLASCPLCRTRLGPAGRAPEGDAAAAAALEVAEAAHDEERRLARRTTDRNATTRLHDRALDLAFSGPQWGGGPVGSNSVMGTNYGWRTGGPASTLYTV